MIWSKIQETELAQKAKVLIDVNGCKYHNWNHVCEMYQYLEKANEPYSEELDWAVLFHDIVYDEQSEKERRSADAFRYMATKFQGMSNSSKHDEIDHLIMLTATHSYDGIGSSAIIRADLHGLANPATTFHNFGKIMEESIDLYSVTPETFALNIEAFMINLYTRVTKTKNLDPAYADFYDLVLRGIISTVALARILRGEI